MVVLAALISATGSLGYALPALVGLESMGVPSPGETALILAGVLASQGQLNIELVLLIAIVSAILGDNIGYMLGRKLGRQVLGGPGPFQKRRVRAIAVGDRFFDRHGSKAVFLGRWVALVRVAAAWLAGINKMKFTHFFMWNALGGITWATTVGLVAYFGGKKVADAISNYGLIGAIVVAAVIAVGVVFWKVRERRAEHRRLPPEPSDEASSEASPEAPVVPAPSAEPSADQ